jgi:hypothetical protein
MTHHPRSDISFDNLGTKCYFGTMTKVKVKMVQLSRPRPACTPGPGQSWLKEATGELGTPNAPSEDHAKRPSNKYAFAWSRAPRPFLAAFELFRGKSTHLPFHE